MQKAECVVSDGGGTGLFAGMATRALAALGPLCRILVCCGLLVLTAPAADAVSNCCVDQGSGNPGCDASSCESCVCALDPFCCDIPGGSGGYWDATCAARAADPLQCAAQCTCGTCGDGVINAVEQCDEGANNQPGISCCSASCQILSGGETCRALASDPSADFSCDVAETCTAGGVCVGGSNNGGSCTGPLDCDPPSAGKCTAVCPADGVQTAGSLCRSSDGVCDPQEECDGSNALCPNDAKSSALCRPSAGVCDLDDFCDGVNDDCPMDAKSSAECRPVAGPCDVAENCDGLNDACPGDALVPANTVCRPLGGGGADIDCDVTESCTGSSPACPPDGFVADGSICSGTDPNACKNACVTGSCTANTPVTQSGCCGNGILDPGEQCDDGNQTSGDACPSLPGDDCVFSAGTGLIRGNRTNPVRDKRGCQVEWAVTNAKDSPDRYGLPNYVQTCVDQDPTCDFDPTPGRCRFQVAVCLNNTNPNLVCNPPNGLSAVTLQSPLRRYGRYPVVEAQANSNHAQVNAALTALLDPNNPGLGYTNSPPLSAAQTNFCSGTMLLEAFSSDFGSFGSRTLTQLLKTKSSDNSVPRPKRAVSQLKLTCEPRPLQ
jgi:cysteine-rich repeat protein